MEHKANEFLWAQSFRPSKVEDCIIPDALKKTFQDFVGQGQVPNFIFAGGAGCGKTTLAIALCEEIGADYYILNGSEEGNIDDLRIKVKGFATSVSLTGAKKVIIIDEADGLNPNSFQPGLRAEMEAVSSNCRFILTCNQKNRIIEPIHSRCTVIDFKIAPGDKAKIAMAFHKRLSQILKFKGVTFDPKVLAELVSKHFPDFRRTLNELQTYAASGTIDSGILLNTSDDSFKELVGYMKGKEFTNVRKWVGRNSDTDTSVLFRFFYDKASELMEPQSIPQMILILADYGYKSSFVVDQEINIMAAMTEIMSGCVWK